MASHNGLSNGVNGTTEVKVVERSMTTTQVKSVQSVSFSSQSVSQSVHIQGMVSRPAIVGSGLQPATHQPGFISNEAIGIQPVVRPDIQQPASPQHVQPIVAEAPHVVTGGNGTSNRPSAVTIQPVSHRPGFVTTQPANPQPATPISIQPIVVAPPQVVAGGTGSTADASNRPSTVTIQPASHRPGFVTTLPVNTQPISIQPVVVAAPQVIDNASGPGLVTIQPINPPISVQPVVVTNPQVITGGNNASNRPAIATIQPASHRPGFVTTQPVIPQPATIPISIQPVVVAAPQIIDNASGPGLITIQPVNPQPVTPQPASSISIQPVVVTNPQVITGGPAVTTIQPASHRPGFVTTLPVNPQPISIQPVVVSAPQVIADVPRPGLVTIQPVSPQAASPISIQPVVVTNPQVITGGTDASNRPAVTTIQPASHRPGFVTTLPANPQPISIQPVVVAAPQVVSGPSINNPSQQPLTREVKDVLEPSLQVIEQPSTKLPEAVATPVPKLPQVIETPAPKLPGNMPGSSDFQIPQYAVNALNQIVQAEGFTNYVINYDRGSNFGDGFVAEIVRAKINGSKMVKGVQQDSELVLVLKLPPDNKTRREMLGMNVFEREVIAYNEIIPMFQKFQLEKGLKPGQGFVSFPKCYYASYNKEKDEAIIIMEDIRKRGFKMQNKYKTVDFPHARFVLETIAQLHGLSLAMKDQCPGVFEKFKGLKDIMANEMMDNDMMKSVTALNCQKAIDTLEPHEENMKQKIRSFGENVVEIVKACSNGESSEPYSVINHGDCWINNMMFKYQSGFPRHLCLLDWQIVRYASPVLDICYFLYLCTDSALRIQHFDSLIQGYHIALRKQVELLGSDINQILPFTALLREMKSKAKFALSTALFIIPMLCTPNAELPNMDDLVESLAKGQISEDNQMIHMTSNTESIYKKRMSGIIRDMNRKGYL